MTSHARRNFLKSAGAATALAVAAPDTVYSAATSPQVPMMARRASRSITPLPIPQLAVIVMNRLTFGMQAGDIAAFKALGTNNPTRLRAWLDAQLNPSAIDDSACDARVAALGLHTLDMPQNKLWKTYFVDDIGNSDKKHLPARQTRSMVWTRAVYSRRQLFEVMAAFWRNHFSVYGFTTPVSSVLPVYELDVIRLHVFGNFRQLLEAVATSTVMGYYLFNFANQVAGPNENWARELFELHTMGAENYKGVADPTMVPKDANGIPEGYVDNDVYEATRCFTGWRIRNSTTDSTIGNTGEFFYYRNWHDRFNKLILSQYLPPDQGDMVDGQQVLDLLASHPGTGRFIARKLCRYLLGGEPSSAMLAAIAGVFSKHKHAPDQLARVVRAIVLHPEFSKTWGGNLKNPFRATTAMLRAVNADWSYSDSFSYVYNAMGMPVYERRTPDGYPDIKEAWSNTSSMVYRWRMANSITEKRFTNITLNISAQMPQEMNTPAAIANYWIKRLLGRSLFPVANRAAIVGFMAQGSNPNLPMPASVIQERLPGLVATIMMTPDFQLM